MFNRFNSVLETLTVSSFRLFASMSSLFTLILSLSSNRRTYERNNQVIIPSSVFNSETKSEFSWFALTHSNCVHVRKKNALAPEPNYIKRLH